jgi:enoyl-CoA hydratase
MDHAGPHVRRITLNRPDRLNALSYPLVAEYHDALDEVAADTDCRVVIVTGAGRGFCAGLDLADYGQPPKPGEHRGAHAGTGGQEFMANIPVHMRATPQVIIAAVNGPAVGGGLSLALGADLRIAGASARFCSAFIKTGLTGTDIGVSYLLPRLIGAARAFDMILTGRTVDAAEAERMGIVSRVVPDAELMDAAVALAGQGAGYTSTGLLLTKEVLWANLDVPSMTAAIALENRNQTIAGGTAEVQEYMDAYAARHRAAAARRSGDQPAAGPAAG